MKPLPPPNAVLQADAGAYGHSRPSSHGSTRGLSVGSSYVSDYNKPQSYSQSGYPLANIPPQYGGWGPYGYAPYGAASPLYGYPPSEPESPCAAPAFGDETPPPRSGTDGQVCFNFPSVMLL